MPEPAIQESRLAPADTEESPSDSQQMPAAAVIMGHLDGVDSEGRLLFRPEGSSKSHPVAIGLALPDDTLVQAARLGQRALAVRTTEARPRLVLTGLVRERVSAAAHADPASRIAAKLDGDSVELTAATQIELRCGRARILLHKSGKIELSGTYLLSRSRGRLKLKGASVEIN